MTQDSGMKALPAGPMSKEDYLKNLEILEEVFANFGVMCFTGTGRQASRDKTTADAYRAYNELGSLVGERMPVSETYAVIPKMYTRVTRGVDEYGQADAWTYFDEHPHISLEKMVDKIMDSTVIEVFVGLELVIRDFRNYTEVAGEYAGTNIMKQDKERTGFMAPNPKARVFDMPLGMIVDVIYLEKDDVMFLTVSDRCGNRFYYGLPAYRWYQPIEGVYTDLRYSAGLGDALMRGMGAQLLEETKAKRRLPYRNKFLYDDY